MEDEKIWGRGERELLGETKRLGGVEGNCSQDHKYERKIKGKKE